MDKPGLIATAYDADWEFLPRPGIRSLRTSWAVEGIVENKIPSEEDSNVVDEGKKVIDDKRELARTMLLGLETGRGMEIKAHICTGSLIRLGVFGRLWRHQKKLITSYELGRWAE